MATNSRTKTYQEFGYQKLQMDLEQEVGFNLKEDFKAALNDPDLSDISFMCNDGVVMYASRLLLATRSAMLRNMLCGQMLEASSNNVQLPEISSVQLTVILEYCYTEETPSLSLHNAVGVYKAAEFFILPRLQVIVGDYVNENLTDYDSAGEMLSQAAVSLETNNDDNSIFGILRQFFLCKPLVEGQLASLSIEGLEVLLADINASKDCPTGAFDLLKCIVDWAFHTARKEEEECEDYETFSSEEDGDREKLLAYLNNAHRVYKEKRAPPSHGISDRSIKAIGRILTPIISKIRFEAMCPHQLAAIVDTLPFVPSSILLGVFRDLVDSEMTCDLNSHLNRNLFEHQPSVRIRRRTSGNRRTFERYVEG